MFLKILEDVVEGTTPNPEPIVKETGIIDWDALFQVIVEWLTTSGVKLLIGVIVLFVTFKIINSFSRGIYKRMEKREVDLTIRRAVRSTIRIALKVLVFIMFLSYVGIDTAGIAGAITSCGVALGLALQGSLSNLAGGIIILIMRPFRIDDYIEAQGESGTVEEIRMFYTQIVTPDNRVIMIPNGALANGNIINVNMKDKRRVDFKFAISYSDDIEKAKKIITDIFAENNLILKTPAPVTLVSELGDSAVIIASRCWVNTEHYWDVFHSVMEKVKAQFDANNIQIPFNQIDVHIENSSKN